MRSLLPLCIAASLAAGCYDSSFSEHDRGGTPEPATTTIRELCDRFVGSTVVVDSDIAVTGRITADGRGGNFYRTLMVEQEGAGLEIGAAADRLHNDYPEGCSVTVRLKGLAVGMRYGVLQVGVRPAAGSSYPTDPIPSKAALDAALVRNGEKLEPVAAAIRTLKELSPGACGTLVRIEGLHYAPEDLAPATWAGYKRFEDDAGTEIHTYVRDYADFADREVPAGRCALTGILQYDAGKERFLLKLRDEKDCTL